MNLQNAYQAVKNWMAKFEQATPEKPTIPPVEVRMLSAKLMLEECLETIVYGLALDATLNEPDDVCYKYLEDVLNALKEGKFKFFEDARRTPNLVAIQDGCSDLHVVTLGTEVTCGLNAEPAFNEVMRSNDSKMWTDKEVADRFLGGNLGAVASPIGFRITVDFGEFSAVRVAPSGHFLSDRCWLVKDKSGKVIKSPSYSPANLKPIIDQQTAGAAAN
jgi:predicted HAD superfamily Cof-like phosphohydrolase